MVANEYVSEEIIRMLLHDMIPGARTWKRNNLFFRVGCLALFVHIVPAGSGCRVDFGPKEPVCGNGIVEGDEICDGKDLRGETCDSLGLGGGTLACRADCTGYDARGCINSPDCGNNIMEAGEVCDGSDLGGRTCSDLGYDHGVLACLSDCSGFDDSRCGFGVCPERWVYIPAGDFEMGCNEGETCWEGFHNESPRHTVTLSSYCIQVTQVSVAEYRECKNGGGCAAGEAVEGGGDSFFNWTSDQGDRENHPINGVNWYAARQYCKWRGGDLPTEAQWEKAARGTDARKYPWGNAPGPICTRCNWNHCYSTDPPGTWPVGYLTSADGDSPYGLKDMAGNVFEWTLDCYAADFYETCSVDCKDPVNRVHDCPGNRVLRGGSFSLGNPAFFRAVYRYFIDESNRSFNNGFRCAMTPGE